MAQHRQRNRAPALPDNARLLAVRGQQSSRTSSRASRHVSRPADNLDGQELVSSGLHQPVSAAETLPVDSPLVVESNTPGLMPDSNSDPSQLQHYSPAVRDIIERAKQISHCDIASVNSFPLRGDFNRKAVEYMNEAIAERRSRGLPIPDGM